MKKFSSVFLTFLLLSANLNAVPMPGGGGQGRIYTFGVGNAARKVEDLRSYARPNQVFNIVPNRPVVATDQSGNRQMFTPSGSMVMSISKDGSRTYSLGGEQRTFDKNGQLLSVSKNVSGTNMIEVTNSFGEIISYRETDMGGKVVAEYDKEKNKTREYVYQQYGKDISAIKNLMTGGQVIYNDKGLPSYSLDYEGNRMESYVYDDLNQLIYKTDAYGNKTMYTPEGNMTHTEDKNGVVLVSYNYGFDRNNNFVLLTSFDPTTNSTTYFKDGRQEITKNYAGAVVTSYCWDREKLLWTFDHESQVTTYYDVDGKTLYSAFNNQLISEYLYYKGQLVGIYDARSNNVTVFKNERKELVIQLGTYGDPITSEKPKIVEIGTNENNHVWGTYEGVDGFEAYDPGPRPTAEDIIRWIESGLIDNKMIVSPL